MPRNPEESPSHGVSSRRRAIIAAVVGIVVGVASGAFIPWPLTPLIAWDVAALTFVTWIWLRVWDMDAVATARHAEREDPTRTAADLMVLIAAVASLIAVGYVLVRAASSGGIIRGLQAGFGVASVVVSWSVVHTVYALRYARLYYAGNDGGNNDGGANFHQEEKPRYSDFAYLSFTVGMTFQVSDTELNDASFRATVLRHSLLSYLFGTVIVALTINLVGGLSH
jgi:uncharacterized membrane protein